MFLVSSWRPVPTLEALRPQYRASFSSLTSFDPNECNHLQARIRRSSITPSCYICNMKDLTAYPISTSTPLEDEQPMDEDTISGQGSLSIALAVVPFPTPNMDMASILNPTPRLTRRSCNKPYTLEQIHFIQYCREDHKLSWPETEVRFKERFTDPARDVSMVGLQCRYYRAQKYPMLDVDGNPVLDDNGMIIMHNLTVRKRGQKEGLKVPILDDNRRPVYNGESQIIMRDLVEDELHGHLGRNLRAVYQTYFKLVDRVPEHAAEYRWVRNEHKTAAKIIGSTYSSPSSNA